MAEYSTQISQDPTISYTTTDHLGSPRVITDKTGNIRSRRDFMPFGEDIFAGVGGRTGDTGQKYSSSADDIRQKFTGYQKDSETSLDFAEARMYQNQYGRFTAIDPLIASGRSANPQTFNRYIYVLNNPFNGTDKTGLVPDWIKEEFTDAKGTFVRPVWVNRTAAPEEAWTQMSYTTHLGDNIILDPMGPLNVEGAGHYWGFSKNGITQGTGVYSGAGAFPMDHSWLSRWQTPEYTPPGYGEAARYNGHGRFTIDADGETDYDTFKYNADKIIAFNLFASFENVYLGGSRQAPKIGSSRTLNTSFSPLSSVEEAFPPIKIGSMGGSTAGKIPNVAIKRQALAENPNRICVFCRQQVNVFHFEHARAKSLGGNATIQNIQIACVFCNLSKGTRQFPVNPAPGYKGPFPPPWWRTQ